MSRGKRPISAHLERFTGVSSRQPGEDTNDPAFWVIAAVLHVDGEEGSPRAVHVNFSARQLGWMLGALPSVISAKLLSGRIRARVLGTFDDAFPNG